MMIWRAVCTLVLLKARKKGSDAPELKLQVIVSCLSLVMRTCLRSSGGAGSSFNSWAISQVPMQTFLGIGNTWERAKWEHWQGRTQGSQKRKACANRAAFVVLWTEMPLLSFASSCLIRGLDFTVLLLAMVFRVKIQISPFLPVQNYNKEMERVLLPLAQNQMKKKIRKLDSMFGNHIFFIGSIFKIQSRRLSGTQGISFGRSWRAQGKQRSGVAVARKCCREYVCAREEHQAATFCKVEMTSSHFHTEILSSFAVFACCLLFYSTWEPISPLCSWVDTTFRQPPLLVKPVKAAEVKHWIAHH